MSSSAEGPQRPGPTVNCTRPRSGSTTCSCRRRPSRCGFARGSVEARTTAPSSSTLRSLPRIERQFSGRPMSSPGIHRPENEARVPPDQDGALQQLVGVVGLELAVEDRLEREDEDPRQERDAGVDERDRDRQEEHRHRDRRRDHRPAHEVERQLLLEEVIGVRDVEHDRFESARDPERDREHDDRDRLVLVEPGQRGGVGRERDRREVHEVPPHEARVHRLETREEAMVPEPVIADHDEADEEGHDLGALPLERLPETRLAHVRDADADDEQRHRDGEHRVAEERDPVELEPERVPDVATLDRRRGRRRPFACAVGDVVAHRAVGLPAGARSPAACRARAITGRASAAARAAPSARMRSTSAGSAASAEYAAWIGVTSSTTASAADDFSPPYPPPSCSAATSSIDRSLAAARIDNRFDTPGLAAGSKRTAVSESVTADLMRFAIDAGGSSRPIDPWGESSDFDIFDSGRCRSMMRAPSGTTTAFGTTKVSPNRWLNRIAMSRASSTCWRWSSPTGTSSVS